MPSSVLTASFWKLGPVAEHPSISPKIIATKTVLIGVLLTASTHNAVSNFQVIVMCVATTIKTS